MFRVSITDRTLTGTTSTGFEDYVQDAAWQKILKDAQAKLGAMPTKGVDKKSKAKSAGNTSTF